MFGGLDGMGLGLCLNLSWGGWEELTNLDGANMNIFFIYIFVFLHAYMRQCFVSCKHMLLCNEPVQTVPPILFCLSQSSFVFT